MLSAKLIRAHFSPAVLLGVVWLVAILVFAYAQSPRTFLDPDSFYHLRLTTMLRDHGPPIEFPWATTSLYQTTFYDHHLGYHLLLIPFVSAFGGEFTGYKLATILFASLSILAIAWVLRRWQVPAWWAWGLLPLTLAPLLFRLSLAKAPSLAIGVAVVAFYLVTARRKHALFWWTWFNTLLYSSWPLIPVFVALLMLVQALEEWPKGWLVMARTFLARQNLMLGGVVIAGITCGLVINPYFPQNIIYLKQLLGMALVPYYKFLGIGGEWYPFNPFDLPEYLAYGFMVWLLATVVGVITFKRQATLARITWLTTLLFLIYTLRARRQAEYLAPWLVLSAALMVRDCGWASITKIKELWQGVAEVLPDFLKKRWLGIMLVGYLVILVPFGLWRGIATAHDSLVPGFTSSRLLGVSQYLREHGQPGEVVFQVDWSTFPLLWYHNPRSYYLTGLDQTFMYEAGPARYWEWLALVRGERRQAYELMRDKFGARYLLVEKRAAAVLLWVNRDERFKRVYEDLDVLLYQL